MKKNLLYWLSICILHVHSYIYLAPHIPTKKVTRATTSVYYFEKTPKKRRVWGPNSNFRNFG